MIFTLVAIGLTAATLLSPSAAPAQNTSPTRFAPVVPAERMIDFLAAVRRKRTDSIVPFFPRSGRFAYAQTVHERAGTRTGAWQFPATEALSSIATGGPLELSFTINPHGQPIGRFYQQVILRGMPWRRVRGNRFVPPGAPASSPIFVEWRREDGEWVIAAFGDESFREGVPLPSWCC